MKSQAAGLTVRSADAANGQTLFHCRPPLVSASSRAYQHGIKEQLDEYSKFPFSVADERRKVDGRPFERVSESELPSNRAQLTVERINLQESAAFESIVHSQ